MPCKCLIINLHVKRSQLDALLCHNPGLTCASVTMSDVVIQGSELSLYARLPSALAILSSSGFCLLADDSQTYFSIPVLRIFSLTFSLLLSVSINCRYLNLFISKTELLISLQTMCFSCHQLNYFQALLLKTCFISVTPSLTLISSALPSPASQHLWTPTLLAIPGPLL